MSTGYCIHGRVSSFQEGGSATAKCAKCGVECSSHDLQCLPEVCAYARQLFEFMHGAAPEPKALPEGLVLEKYGYGSESVFCEECFSDVVRGAKRGIQL